MAIEFPRYMIGFICDEDFEIPYNKYGFIDDKVYGLYDYAYLKESVDTVLKEDCVLRELSPEDESAMASFSKLAAPVVYGVFEQKYKYGNYASVKILGLFIRGEFVGCAMLSFEQARSIKISDMGGLYLLPEHNTAQNREMLYICNKACSG